MWIGVKYTHTLINEILFDIKDNIFYTAPPPFVNIKPIEVSTPKPKSPVEEENVDKPSENMELPEHEFESSYSSYTSIGPDEEDFARNVPPKPSQTLELPVNEFGGSNIGVETDISINVPENSDAPIISPVSFTIPRVPDIPFFHGVV